MILKQFCFVIALASCLLTGCETEQDLRGISTTKWQQLSPEQKQLIVDQSFQKDFHQSQQ